MKFLTTLCVLLFFTSISYAQLSVREDAYIYVSDRVVFVQDKITLGVNSDETSPAIYLRDEAQLIQGTENINNSGRGRLSVEQEGTVHNYAFNYWASPVGNVDAVDDLNRTFRADDVIFESGDIINPNDAIFINGYDGYSSPLRIASYWLYAFNPGVAYSEWDHLLSTGEIDAGYGFTMKGSDGSTGVSYDFRGKPNSGTIATDILAEQNTLVGNPYPSALDALKFIHDPDNVAVLNGTLYFWEQDQTVMSHNTTSYVGGYAQYTINSNGTVMNFTPAVFKTYNADGSVNDDGPANTSSKEVKEFIPIGQGFMVEGKSGIPAPSVTTFKNEHRVYYRESGDASEFFKTNHTITQLNTTVDNGPEAQSYIVYDANGVQILPAHVKRFRLNVDFDDTYTRQISQTFTAEATPGFDYGLELKNASDETAEVYFKNDNDASKILGQAFSFDEDLKIPLYFELSEAKSVRIRIFDIQNFADDQDIYIHDINNEIYYNLREQNFNINLSAGLYLSNYEITFKESDGTLSVSSFEDSSYSVLQNNNTAQLVINNPENLDIKSFKLIDISGKQLIHTNTMKNQSRYEFDTNNLSDGVYIAITTLKTNETLNKKIVITNK
ncbi:T9SS type A sorting domain-containing protein [Bizionia gelidisalsuginis]|uniref:T9SS type A sorting domain-containing protein n=1 Tax=Bizionia gelidisalsuginis TaxID=291188 RepID=A0ABY3MC64_9FLAO|nr:T9SS type A sorting domain-containing protein [Bizionia gelidisalsuginis]TYC14900.1 T9SS type A sorting domain-containing protein [Bizionia gelidisalsuginis]